MAQPHTQVKITIAVIFFPHKFSHREKEEKDLGYNCVSTGFFSLIFFCILSTIIKSLVKALLAEFMRYIEYYFTHTQ